ncbi:MAG: zinc ribbon domain-containing protein [Bacillota bacterium]|nr:zinc ribbon domain-containing protein [Bacillota bacterium]
MKMCIACGMPMKTKDDFAMRDESKDYCKYCARPDGTMQSYEEKLEGMTDFIIRTQGLDEEAARNAAKGMMMKLPAWKE